MASNSQKVSRLRADRRAILEFAWQDPPGLPDEFIHRFPSLQAYNQKMAEWWKGQRNAIESFISLQLDKS